MKYTTREIKDIITSDLLLGIKTVAMVRMIGQSAAISSVGVCLQHDSVDLIKLNTPVNQISFREEYRDRVITDNTVPWKDIK